MDKNPLFSKVLLYDKIQGPPSQTDVFYFARVYTYIDRGYYLGIYSFQYPCTILDFYVKLLNFDSIYPFKALLDQARFLLFCLIFMVWLTGKMSFSETFGSRIAKEWTNFKKPDCFEFSKSYFFKFLKKFEFWWCLSDFMDIFLKMTFWSLFWLICN